MIEFGAQFILVIIMFLAALVLTYMLLQEIRVEVFLILFAIILSLGYTTGNLESWSWGVIILSTSVAVFMMIKNIRGE